MPKFSLALVAAFAMTATTLTACDKDHRSGLVQKATGQVEATVGHLTRNYELEHNGERDKVAGDVKSALGDVKDTARQAAKP